MGKTRHEIVIFIGAEPTQVWSAITEPDQTRHFWYGTDILSDWTPGARWTSEAGDERYLEGEIVEIEAPRHLVQTMRIVGNGPGASSIVTWEITPMGDASRLRLVHSEMDEATWEYVEEGWELILSGLKTWLETGHELKVGEPAAM